MVNDPRQERSKSGSGSLYAVGVWGGGGGKEVPCIGKVETRASGYHIIFSYFTCLVCSPI